MSEHMSEHTLCRPYNDTSSSLLCLRAFTPLAWQLCFFVPLCATHPQGLDVLFPFLFGPFNEYHTTLCHFISQIVSY